MWCKSIQTHTASATNDSRCETNWYDHGSGAFTWFIKVYTLCYFRARTVCISLFVFFLFAFSLCFASRFSLICNVVFLLSYGVVIHILVSIMWELCLPAKSFPFLHCAFVSREMIQSIKNRNERPLTRQVLVKGIWNRLRQKITRKHIGLI